MDTGRVIDESRGTARPVPGFGVAKGQPGRHVLVVGAGGNIGSSVVRHVARIPEVAYLTLIDRDHYEAGNLAGQDIVPTDIGRAKAVVQRERATAIRPDLLVSAIVADLETLPMGVFDCDLILACLDSPSARQGVNRLAWRLGVPWLDAGVSADGLLARVDSFRPGPGAACLECSWTERHYQVLEQAYLCTPETGVRGPSAEGAPPPQAPPTGAPSALGGMAASIQALEAGMLLGGSAEGLKPGSQIVLSAAHHRFHRTTRPVNPQCRFDHSDWQVECLDFNPSSRTLKELLEWGRSRLSPAGSGSVEVRCDGMRFARRLICSGCGGTRPILRLIPGPLGTEAGKEADAQCSTCGGKMNLTGWGVVDRFFECDAAPDELDRTLEKVGIRPLEIVSLRIPEDDAEIHVQVGSSPASRADGPRGSGSGGAPQVPGPGLGSRPEKEMRANRAGISGR